MGILTLYSAILLPWIGGTFWLAFVDAQLNKNGKVNRFRQAGYGFFLGYAVLFLAIMGVNKLTGVVSWPQLMVLLSVFAASGALAVRLGPKQQNIKTGNPGVTPTALPKFLFAIAMVLMTVHLVFIAVEIFTQPVYPWDAWIVWVYRAKAWFLSGGISDMASPAEWATANSANIYTIDAWTYPMFPSVIPYWAALSLGRWSETLINLPVLFAGLAMAMALYGQCREHGLSVSSSLISCYFLLSIPLFGTHLALAGYADIWMAGFAGLGYVALMRGIIMSGEGARLNVQMILGFLMVIFSICVKNEGAVWFLAALAMLILASFRSRVIILMMVTVTIVTLLAFAFGFSYIEIPMIGKLGLVNDRLAIPFIGHFTLEVHDVRYAYWENSIYMGSWNLLWPIMTATLLIALRSMFTMPSDRTGRTAMSFILIFVATQLFIFGFTNQGVWADTYTAINRLPLHFVPALLFTVAVVAKASMKQSYIDKATVGECSGNA